MTNEELAALSHINHEGWNSRVIDITFCRSEGKAGLLATLDRIAKEAEAAADDGIQLVVLSDRKDQRMTEYPSARCWRPGRFIITWSAKPSELGSGWWSKPVKPEKFITTVC